MNNKFEFIINQKIIPVPKKIDFVEINEKELISYTFRRDVDTIRSITGTVLDVTVGASTAYFELALSMFKINQVLNDLRTTQRILFEGNLYVVMDFHWEQNLNQQTAVLKLECRVEPALHSTMS